MCPERSVSGARQRSVPVLGGGGRWLLLAFFAICSLTAAGEVGAICAPGEPAR